MASPQLSVRSARARDLAHELSRKENRPIHAIVEDALNAYARAAPRETTAEWLKRMRAIGPADGEVLTAAEMNEAIDEMQAHIDANRRIPHEGIDL
jgi:hypothetical protein